MSGTESLSKVRSRRAGVEAVGWCGSAALRRRTGCSSWRPTGELECVRFEPTPSRRFVGIRLVNEGAKRLRPFKPRQAKLFEFVAVASGPIDVGAHHVAHVEDAAMNGCLVHQLLCVVEKAPGGSRRASRRCVGRRRRQTCRGRFERRLIEAFALDQRPTIHAGGCDVFLKELRARIPSGQEGEKNGGEADVEIRFRSPAPQMRGDLDNACQIFGDIELVDCARAVVIRQGNGAGRVGHATSA
jgi:hypothetical protein